MKKFPLFATALLALPFTTVSLAADDARIARAKAQIETRFTDADVNRDGKLSREEARKMPRLARVFDQIDTEQTGYVSKEQVMQSMAALARK